MLVVLKETIEEDQGFLMNHSIGDMITLAHDHRDREIAIA